MRYLLSIISAANGDVSDVDVALEDLDLATPEGQKTLAEAVQIALNELNEDADESN
jgi:UrcA family protein